MDLGWQELLVVLLIAVLLFGGTKLAGIGRASGKAIREFKEETETLHEKDKKGAKKGADQSAAPQAAAQQAQAPQILPGQGYQASPYQQQYAQPQQIVEGEIVDPRQNS